MKKKLALLLVATMSTMAFIGCTKPQQKEEAVESSTKETEAEDVSDEVEATAPEYATTSVKYDTDSKFYTGSVECLQITDANHANLQKAVDKEFSKIVESFNKTSADYVDEAKKYNEDMASGEDETDGVEPITYNYYYSTTAKVTRCDSKIFSVMLSTEVYTGGAHGSHYDEGIIFDSQTGKILSVADLGITADSVHQYVDTLLEESPEEATGGLFEDYQDTVDSSLSGDMSDVSLWLDDRGLVVEFSEYSLAAYAAGNIKFTVPYSELTGFDSAYLPENDFYAISLSDLGLIDKIDANDDGTLENIYVTNTVDEDAMEVVYTLHLGDQELAYNADSSMYYVSFYYVHSAGGNFVFADASMDNGFNETTLYKVGDTIKEIDKNEYAVSEISDGTLKMTAIRDALGTWTVIDEFSYDANGFTRKNTAEKIDNNPSSNSDARGIKLKADMEYLLDYNDKDSIQTIESGSLIYPVTIIDSSDGTVIGFVTEDGTTGYVYYKEDSSTGSHTINGIDEMELFEELPYAG